VIPTNGLRAFSHKITTLTSLTCSNIGSINSTDINLIVDCFPLLQELDLSYPAKWNNFLLGVETLSLTLFNLRKVNISGYRYINNKLIFNLFSNFKHLEEVIMLKCHPITDADVVASALRERPSLRSLSISSGISITNHFIDSLVSLKGLTCLELSYWRISDQLLSSIAKENLPLRRFALAYCTGYSYVGVVSLLSNCQRIQHLVLKRADFLKDRHVALLSSFLGDLVSINLSGCSMLTESSLFALNRKCPSLNEIIMACTRIAHGIERNCVVSPQLKYLHLANNDRLQNKKIVMFASNFPNLELLDLSNCFDISEEGICHVLRRCSKIRHLNLSRCSIVKLQGMNFEVQLEVLNLSYTSVGSEDLYVISKRCPRLLQLSLQNCKNITIEGVIHVVKNCRQIGEINLHHCHKVSADAVVSMVRLRPSFLSEP
jgi:F-box and leucine-rich repeat protein 2/20